MHTIEELEQWVNSREPSDRVTPQMPLTALISDAERAIQAASEYWSSTGNRPGLEHAGFGLNRDIIVNIEYMKNGLLFLNEKYISQVETDLDNRQHILHAQQLLSDFSSFLEWYIASDENSDKKRQTEKIQKDYTADDPSSSDELAYALFEYASLSKDILMEKKEIDGISMKTVDEAFDLVSKLVDVNNEPAPLSEETRKLATLKSRMAASLREELEKLRKAAGFVFRNHPEIVRKFSSAYIPMEAAAEYRARKIDQSFYRRLNQKVPLRFLPKM